MKKPEWPGIATAIGAILIATLFAVGWRDDFHLKDYATVIAAFVAVGGAWLAYNGAMAKVYEDRDRELRELNRKKMGVYLRLRFAVEKIGNSAAAKSFLFRPPAPHVEVVVNPLIDHGRLRIGGADELADAWNNLELFPLDVSILIDRMRKQLSEIEAMLHMQNTIGVPLLELMLPGELIGGYRNVVAELESTASTVVATLDTEIRTLGIGAIARAAARPTS